MTPTKVKTGYFMSFFVFLHFENVTTGTMKRITLIFLLAAASVAANAQISELVRQGQNTQLLIGGESYIILGGELANSSASSGRYMDSRNTWEYLKESGLNTVLAPVYWELIEPQQGRYDFSTVDYLLKSARANDLKLILLWFGTWKNSMSCYVPSWVKRGFGEEFDLARNSDGNTPEIMTAFSESNVRADSKAFATLMRYLKKADGAEGTVIMVQVENEIGMLGDARDHSRLAQNAYESPVPYEVIYMLESGKANDYIYNIWKSAGGKRDGSWKEVFGEGLEADEIFMAYWYARYTERVAFAGKEEYDIPMFVNTALNSRGRKAGDYPSAGPLAHLMPIWKLAAPSIDLICPDIYDKGYPSWIGQYATPDNQLFIPEIRQEPENGARVFYALGRHAAIGFSPFSIDNMPEEEDYPLKRAYEVLTPALDLIAEKQAAGKTYGMIADIENKETTLRINNIDFRCRHDLTLGWNPEASDPEKWGETSVMIIDMGSDTYLFMGTGVVTTMSPADGNGKVGIERIDEIVFDEYGKMQKMRRLNGDEDHQGRHIRIPFNEYGAQLLKVYRY